MTEQVNTYNGQRANNDPPRGYPWIDITTETEEFAVRTIEAIMLDVGDSAELAQAAKAEELSRDYPPRKTLITRLEKVIADAEEAS